MSVYQIKPRSTCWGRYAVCLSFWNEVGEVKARSTEEAERKAIQRGLVEEGIPFFVSEIVEDDRVTVLEVSKDWPFGDRCS